MRDWAVQTIAIMAHTVHGSRHTSIPVPRAAAPQGTRTMTHYEAQVRYNSKTLHCVAQILLRAG